MISIGFFSVVIPNYKRVDELVRAVKSVLEQADLVEEIIIVDDLSDNIEEIERAVDNIGSDKIRLVKNTFKSNAAQTRNQGGRLAKSQWVLLLDSDDVFLEGKLTAIKNEISKNVNDKVVYYNTAQVWFDNKLEKIAPSRPLEVGEHISDYLFIDSEIMQTSTLAVPKYFFDEVGFNETYTRHQDYDLCLSLYHAGFAFKLVDVQGTAIYWSSATRPTDKGESAEYSLAWAVENRHRMTPSAFDNFYFYFVVLKLLRAGQKRNAVRELRFISKASSVSAKKKFMFVVLFIMPSFFMDSAYILYKNFVTKFFAKKSW